MKTYLAHISTLILVSYLISNLPPPINNSSNSTLFLWPWYVNKMYTKIKNIYNSHQT